MKKNFKFYAVTWALLFAVYNVLAFAVGFKNTANFWAAYIASAIAMLLQLICAKISFKPGKLDRLFLNIPVIKITFTGMIISMVIGVVCMVIPSVSVVAIIVIEYLILAFMGISVLKANATAEIVNDVGEKVKEKTQFIKLATVDAQNLMDSAKSESVKSACKRYMKRCVIPTRCQARHWLVKKRKLRIKWQSCHLPSLRTMTIRQKAFQMKSRRL